jgi:integrase
MRSERRAKAHGPYRRGSKWRVVETSAAGARSTCAFDSEAEALDYIAEFNDEAEGRTVSGTLDQYLEHAKGQGLRPGSITTLRFRLKAITRVVERDRLLSAVTPVAAAEMYAARVAKVKADTHRGELAAVTAMFAWCVKKGWLRANPFSGVEKQGRKARRKEHLRFDEARAFRDAAISDAHDGGLAAAMALLMGMRASEIVNLHVRDIDDDARVVWIFGAKTEAGDRHLEVPDDLRARLRSKVKGRDAIERVFGDADRRWLIYHVHRICDLAKLGRKVSPHALRRTTSALGAEVMPIGAIAAMLGQRGEAVNRRHYQPTNSEERRVVGAALRALDGGRTS